MERARVSLSEVDPQTLATSHIQETFFGAYLLIRVHGEEVYKIIFSRQRCSHVALLAAWLTRNKIRGFCNIYGGGRIASEEGTIKLRGASGSYGSLGIGMKPIVEQIAGELELPIECEYKEHYEELLLENLLLMERLEVVD